MGHLGLHKVIHFSKQRSWRQGPFFALMCPAFLVLTKQTVTNSMARPAFRSQVHYVSVHVADVHITWSFLLTHNDSDYAGPGTFLV